MQSRPWGLTIRSSRPHVVASAVCFTLRLHTSAAPPQGGLTQALGAMPSIREHSQKRALISFYEETERLEFELTFNVGNKVAKPVKFMAHQTWRTSGAPSLFSGTRGSFSSQRAAETYLASQFVAAGGEIHEHSEALISKLVALHGYNRA